jgi:predicted N-acetyltransferase YhbS
MNIRESIISDLGAIHASHKNAFGEPEGAIVAQLACDILKDESAQPLLSLVVEQQDEIVGHVIFSSLKIEGCEHLSVYILAPLAVSKNFQRQGLGTQLITDGLNILKSQGFDAVFVYGAPSYYGRIGFKLGHSIAAPYELEYPEAWMALELKQGCLLKVQGLAKCCDSLMSPEHW